MDMSGEVRIPASQERVWAALNDPETLRQAIPGCEELTKISDTELEAAARAKIGPVSARFKGKVTLSDLQPPNGYTLSGEGTGGAAGFAKGAAQVSLRPDGDGTILHYTVKATVGGKLAQIGQRMIDGAARQMADDFFARFAAQLAPADAIAEEEQPILEDDVVAPPVPPPATREGIGPEIWVVGLIGVVIILLVLFGTVLQSA